MLLRLLMLLLLLMSLPLLMLLFLLTGGRLRQAAAPERLPLPRHGDEGGGEAHLPRARLW